MTRNRKGKNFQNTNKNSNQENWNSDKNSSDMSNFNPPNQNATGKSRNNSNSYDGGHQKRTGSDFRYNYNNDSENWNTHANKGNYGREFRNNHQNKSGEENNIRKGFGRGFPMQNSNDYYSKHSQQFNQKEPFINDPSSDYVSTHNGKARGQNTNVINGRDPISQSNLSSYYSKKDENYKRFNYENSKQIDSNFQKVTKSSDFNMAFKKGENDEHRDASVKDIMDNSSKNFENKGYGDHVQNSKENVNYISQKSFLETLNRAEDSSETKKYLPVPEKPVPSPRTSLSKSEDDGKGARKKQKGDNYSGYCMNCEKYLAQREFHKSHRVLPIDKAITELKEQNQSKIVTVIEELNSQLTEKKQKQAIINLSEKSINPCLVNVFKELKTSSSLNLDELNQIRDSGVQIINNSSVDNINDVIKLIDFQDKSKKIITASEKLLSDSNYNSCWLIFSWFKMSIGLIIQSGVKVFTETESKKSKSSYANFDLYGDRLRLFSFKRNITPDRDAVILPFEPIRALFKNEDSKSFMIVGSNAQEGQVVIRINKEVFWGRQFISLCLGDLGPSLRNTCFFRSCGRGKPYHHIWGGDYSQNDGSGGEAFLPWDEPLKPSSDFIVKGLLAARYGNNDKNSIFRIYIKGPEQTQPTKENFCFGYVEEGMETLEFFASQSDVTTANIKDAGCFLILK